MWSLRSMLAGFALIGVLLSVSGCIVAPPQDERWCYNHPRQCNHDEWCANHPGMCH
jgi:hypothetical protein